jgi:hypothetical protein
MAIKSLSRQLELQMILGVAAGLMLQPVSGADAQVFFGSGGAGSGNNFSSISQNMTSSVEDLPGLLTGFSYLFGLLLGATAIMKMRDHVENPRNTPIKDSAIRMAVGGALFALPIVFEAMLNTAGARGSGASAALLYKGQFNVQ